MREVRQDRRPSLGGVGMRSGSWGGVPHSNYINNDFTGDMDVDLNLTITNCNQTIERYSKEETLK